MKHEISPVVDRLSTEKREILDGQFDFYYGTKKDGDFKPTSEGFFERLEQVRKRLGITYIFAPSLAFTKRTGSLTGEQEVGYVVGPKNQKLKYADEGILRTEAKADGGVLFYQDLRELGVSPDEVALAGFNADCPFIIGYDEERQALFMLHAGLGCIHKPNDDKKETIFENLVRDYGLNPKKIKIFVTAGIQKCCYGRNDDAFQKVFDEWGGDLQSVATIGDREGQTSLDLSGLIEKDLLRVGVAPENITVDKHCTCHDGEHWSNVNGEDERNLLLVKMRKI